MTDSPPEPNWSHPPPMPTVVVDAAVPGVEVWMRAGRDQRGVVSAPHALIRRDPDGPAEDAAVIAWARPGGTRGWPWVLVVWMDHVAGGRYTSTVAKWRSGWLAYDPLLLEHSEREPRRANDYWRVQRAEAIINAVVHAGLQNRQARPVEDDRRP